jgi:hypothetical protein
MGMIYKRGEVYLIIGQEGRVSAESRVSPSPAAVYIAVW